jgi:adhesin/invasin
MKNNYIKSVVYFVVYLTIILSSSSFAEYSNDNPFSVASGTMILAGGNPPNTSLNTLKDLANKAKQLNINSVRSNIANNLGEKGKEVTQTYLEKYFPTVELELDLMNESNPTSSILILAPLSDPNDTINTFFTQDSIFYSDNRTTVNLGVGYRRLEWDKKLLLGINAFYDHEFPYNHQRTSLGFEARTTVGEINANIYNSLTDWRDGRDGLDERGLDGRDIEIGIPLPYMNWAYVFAKAFTWDSELSGVKDISGTNLSVRAKPPSLRGIEIEFGRVNYGNTSSNAEKDANFFKISVNLTELFKTSADVAPLVSKHAYQLGDMEAQRYEKVRRENKIYKQMRSNGQQQVMVSGF